MDKRVPVIVNASSGSQRTATFSADLAARFKPAGVGVEIMTAGPTEIVAEVRHAAIAKPHMIVIGGGDGTLSGLRRRLSALKRCWEFFHSARSITLLPSPLHCQLELSSQ